MADEVSRLLRVDLVRLGLTQEEFANKLGVTQQAVSAWYARNVVPHRRLKAIEEVLGPDSQLVTYMRLHRPPQVLRDRSHEIRAIREVKPRQTEAQISNKGTSYARPSIVVQMQEDARQFQELIESELPGARTHVEVRIGEKQRQFDYMSDNLCVEVLRLPYIDGRLSGNYAPRVYTKLVMLMLYKRLTEKDFPDRHFGIIAMSEDPTLEKSIHFSRLQWECEQFDVSLTVVPHIEAAADFVIQIENSISDTEESDF